MSFSTRPVGHVMSCFSCRALIRANLREGVPMSCLIFFWRALTETFVLVIVLLVVLIVLLVLLVLKLLVVLVVVVVPTTIAARMCI
jgi:hypothetical protein